MYRFFIPLEQIFEKEAFIWGDDVNHIRNVLRMTIGEKVSLSDGRGKEYICQIAEFLPDKIRLAIDEIRPDKSELPVQITLFQALPKKDKMEMIIQKAVELGVYEIVPVKTKRCIVKLDDEKKMSKKLTRWQTIAQTAAKQSGRGVIPDVLPAMDFGKALEYASSMDMSLIPYELMEDMEGSLDAVKKAAKSRKVGIFIGPEGGFERGEIEKAMANGAIPISLGKRILRTETAGLAILSVLMFHIEADI